MPANLSGPTLIVILFIVLLLFGAPKLPALAKSLGQSMKILKKEVAPGDDKTTTSEADAADAADAADVVAAGPSVEEQLAAAKAEAEAARAEAEALRAQTAAGDQASPLAPAPHPADQAKSAE